ncbi:substrate-binding domain-containing protein [Aureimonas sp. ME7]|uniref:substrate-binding domain-containing protein n=1 Tax=Aureimonas sp. ME7 TaxID=2744252 RepID=UPI001AEE4AE1|nr:substrate-binding domain-containing protein [Aureimonas sp. ME7]
MKTKIVLVSSMAMRQILGELAERYEAETGCLVDLRPMGGVDAANRVREGDAADAVVLARDAMADLERAGHVRAGSTVSLARSGMAVAVPTGAPHPDLSDEAGFRTSVFGTSRIAYSTGPSGNHFLRLCERWGLLPDGAERLVKAPPGVPVGDLLARGEAALGVQQLSELLNVPGIEIVGPLPPEIQSITVFSAGVAASSRRPEEAGRLIAFLADGEAAQVKRRHGMEAA